MKHRLLPWGVLALLACLPFVLPALGLGFYVGFVRRLMIVALAAMSLNLLIGGGGMVALGHAAFVGVGAYTVVALADGGVASAWLMLPAALVVAGLVAALIGAVSLRTKGVYFIMITLAFAQMLYYAVVSLRRYGGDDGYTLTLPATLGAGLTTASGDALYALVLMAAAPSSTSCSAALMKGCSSPCARWRTTRCAEAPATTCRRTGKPKVWGWPMSPGSRGKRVSSISTPRKGAAAMKPAYSELAERAAWSYMPLMVRSSRASSPTGAFSSVSRLCTRHSSRTPR